MLPTKVEVMLPYIKITIKIQWGGHQILNKGFDKLDIWRWPLLIIEIRLSHLR